jgi:hypothetical protein
MTMIRWIAGDCEIVANCGCHKPNEHHPPTTLVRVRYDDGREAYCFAGQLGADGGAKEIVKAIAAAPVVALGPRPLRDAIAEARGI